MARTLRELHVNHVESGSRKRKGVDICDEVPHAVRVHGEEMNVLLHFSEDPSGTMNMRRLRDILNRQLEMRREGAERQYGEAPVGKGKED